MVFLPQPEKNMPQSEKTASGKEGLRRCDLGGYGKGNGCNE